MNKSTKCRKYRHSLLEKEFERRNMNRDFADPVELARDNIIAGNFSKRKGSNFFRRYNLTANLATEP
jgi:hypothetical protein